MHTIQQTPDTEGTFDPCPVFVWCRERHGEGDWWVMDDEPGMLKRFHSDRGDRGPRGQYLPEIVVDEIRHQETAQPQFGRPYINWPDGSSSDLAAAEETVADMVAALPRWRAIVEEQP